MIAKSTEVALLCGVDKFAAGQAHKVEVLDTFLVILFSPIVESLLANDFADVFKNERVWCDIIVDPETKTLLLSTEDSDIGPLLALQPLILTI